MHPDRERALNDGQQALNLAKVAYFVMKIRKMKGVTLSGGIRNEKPSGFDLGSYTTKSYKLAWDPTKKDTIYAGRSEFFILPSMDQLFNKS